jgi:hypothetical protein
MARKGKKEKEFLPRLISPCGINSRFYKRPTRDSSFGSKIPWEEAKIESRPPERHSTVASTAAFDPGYV